LFKLGHCENQTRLKQASTGAPVLA